MTGVPLTEIAVMRGPLGSSENSAVQGRFASSFQWTVAEPAVEVTVTGPGRTAETSRVTAGAKRQNSSKRKTDFGFRISDFGFIMTPLWPCSPIVRRAL